MNTQRHAPRQTGFALMSVLIAVGVITGLVATYGRHVVVEGRSNMASTPLLESREACHSGVRFARQAMVSGTDISSATVPSGSCSADISVTTLPLGNKAVQIESVGQDGLGARRVLEMGLDATPGSELSHPSKMPTLDAGTVAALLADPSLTVTHHTSSTTLQDAELSGLHVVHPGVQLTVDDVVLTGAFVSSAVLDQTELGDYSYPLGPRVVVAGNLRVDAHPALAGLAVLLPDGTFQGTQSDARIQIHGDVVAHTFYMQAKGVLDGNVAAVMSYMNSAVDRLGIERKGHDWSSELMLGGTMEPRFLAAVPASSALSQLSGIINYWNTDGN